MINPCTPFFEIIALISSSLNLGLRDRKEGGPRGPSGLLPGGEAFVESEAWLGLGSNSGRGGGGPPSSKGGVALVPGLGGKCSTTMLVAKSTRFISVTVWALSSQYPSRGTSPLGTSMGARGAPAAATTSLLTLSNSTDWTSPCLTSSL